MTESKRGGKKPLYIYINTVSQIACLFPPRLLILSSVLQESFDSLRTPTNCCPKFSLCSNQFVFSLPLLTIPSPKVSCYSLHLTYASRQPSLQLLIYFEFTSKCLNITRKRI